MADTTITLPCDTAVMVKTRVRKDREAGTLPFEPLERLIPHNDDSSRAEEVAFALGVTIRQVFRFRHTGLDHRVADRLACRLGLVPEIIEGWKMSAPKPPQYVEPTPLRVSVCVACGVLVEDEAVHTKFHAGLTTTKNAVAALKAAVAAIKKLIAK